MVHWSTNIKYFQFSKRTDLSLPRLKKWEYLKWSKYVRKIFIVEVTINIQTDHPQPRHTSLYVCELSMQLESCHADCVVGRSVQNATVECISCSHSCLIHHFHVSPQIRILVDCIWRSVWQIFCTTTTVPSNGEAILEIRFPLSFFHTHLLSLSSLEGHACTYPHANIHSCINPGNLL